MTHASLRKLGYSLCIVVIVLFYNKDTGYDNYSPYKQQNELLKQRIQTLVQQKSAVLVATGESLSVTVTAYHMDPRQTDDTPRRMANGRYVADVRREPPTIAVSRDIYAQLAFGDWVYVRGVPAYCGTSRSGWYKVQDLMHPRWQRRIDILLPISTPAFRVLEATLVIPDDPQRISEQLHQLSISTQRQC